MSRKTRRNKRRKQKSLMSPDVAVTIAVAAPEEREQKANGGQNKNTKEYMAPLNLKSRPSPSNMYAMGTLPIFEKESTRTRFNKAFAEARKEGKDTFMFEGNRFTTDYPVSEKDKAAQAAGRANKAEGGESKFPDLTGDGRVTQADILKGRNVFQEGGEVPVDTYPNIPPNEMEAVMASQLPDQQMEDQFIDYVINESLNNEEQRYLMNALEGDPQLSMIFDKVVGTASEFTGSGEVKGPGTGVSDSIPAKE